MFYKVLLCSFSILSLISSYLCDTCKEGVQCIPLDECKGLNDQLRRENSPQLTKLLRSLHCGFDLTHQYRPKICCPSEYTKFAATAESLLPSLKNCGMQYEYRLIVGNRTLLDEQPWTALLKYVKPSSWDFHCGGVLISQRYVLTAAHCVKGSDLPSDWTLTQVRLGEHKISDSGLDCDDDDCALPPQDVAVEEVISHEGYDPEDVNQYNDIALLRLSSVVNYTDFVKPICLPLSDQFRQQTVNNHGAYDIAVLGWGKTFKNESRTESDVKLRLWTSKVNLSTCAETYEPTGRRIKSSQLCADAESQIVCRGDSGGALVVASRPINWIVAGVESFVSSCGESPARPGVYTRVTSYIDWILSKLRT